MTNNIVALFEKRASAEAARSELINEGFSDSAIKLIAQQEGAAATTATHADTSLWEDVKDFFGFGHEDELRDYQEGVRRGGTLLVVTADAGRVETATDVLMRFNPVDIEKQAGQWKAESGRSSQAQPQARAGSAGLSAGATARANPANADAGQAIPVVEEQLKVGKRQVNRGIRVHQRVTEKPVEEQVQLRDERVTVERRPVDRAAVADAPAAAFQERTFDVTETHEEPVVSKEARVVEEVVVNRQARQRTETVRDTVRRTDVDVEPIGQTGQTASTVDDESRKIYTSDFANKGYTYEQFKPAYDFGSKLAADQSYRGRDWSTVESDARSSFERGNPGSTWDQVRDAVHRAYDRARAKV